MRESKWADMSKRMEWTLREKAKGTRIGDAIERRDKLRVARRVVLPALLLAVAGSFCATAAPGSSRNGSSSLPLVAQEPPPTGRELAFAVQNIEPYSEGMKAVALRFIATLREGELGRWDTEENSRRIILGLAAVGTSGLPNAPALLLPAVRSSDPAVSSAAATWYRVVDPQWKSDPEIRRLINQASANNPAGGGH